MESAISALGIPLGRGNEDEVFGLCPKHVERTGKEDRHPSWSVNRHTGLHGCWSCGYSGNFLGLVMDLKFPNDAWAAAKWIRQFGVNLEAAVERLSAPAVEEEPEVDLPGRFAMYVDPPPWAMQRRHLSAEACAHYGVRWDDRRDRWIIPIRRPGGELVGWQIKAEKGRFFRNFPMKTPKGECLFGYDQLPAEGAAMVLESPLDVVRLYAAGVAGGVSTYGASFTEAQMRLLAEAAREVVLAFDDDAGGYQATHMFLRGNPKKGRKAWAPRFHVDLLNYEGVDAKDIGDMTDDEIYRAIDARKFWLNELDKYPKDDDELHRDASRLPRGRRQGLRRPWSRTHRHGTGHR